MRTRLLILLAVLLPSIACDQFTKELAVEHLKGERTRDIVGSLFRLTYAENPGAFLGLGRSLPDAVRLPLFIGIALALLIGTAIYVWRAKVVTPMTFAALALFVAGGIGNMIDRVLRPGGRVVDFAVLGVDTPWGRVQTGVFNVADIYIMVAAGLVVWASVTERSRRSPPAPSVRPSAG